MTISLSSSGQPVVLSQAQQCKLCFGSSISLLCGSMMLLLLLLLLLLMLSKVVYV